MMIYYRIESSPAAVSSVLNSLWMIYYRIESAKRKEILPKLLGTQMIYYRIERALDRVGLRDLGF